MNTGRTHLFLMLLFNANITLHGMEMKPDEMELEDKIASKKKLSDNETICKYLFSQKRLINFFIVDRAYTFFLDNVDDFINSFPHVIRVSPNIVTPSDRYKGIDCVIKSGNDLITANSRLKQVTIGQHNYRIYNDVPSHCCSLAYTPKCMVAGFYDGSFIAFDNGLRENCALTVMQCHKAPVTSILCIPSQHIYILGGGNTMRMHKPYFSQATFQDGDLVEMRGKRHSLGNDEKGNPYDADIVAVAGSFIVMQTKEGKPLIQSFYSYSAFNAIKNGTFSEPQKTFLLRWINAKDKTSTQLRSNYGVFKTLCPTIKSVLQNAYYIKRGTITDFTSDHSLKH